MQALLRAATPYYLRYYYKAHILLLLLLLCYWRANAINRTTRESPSQDTAPRGHAVVARKREKPDQLTRDPSAKYRATTANRGRERVEGVRRGKKGPSAASLRRPPRQASSDNTGGTAVLVQATGYSSSSSSRRQLPLFVITATTRERHNMIVQTRNDRCAVVFAGPSTSYERFFNPIVVVFFLTTSVGL